MKRFTETNKWSANPWFRKLNCRLKCLWLFICDTCDHAGVISPDWDLISFQIGEDVSVEDFSAFEDRVEELPNGKFWIRDFIAFQHGELSEKCNAHAPVLRSLKANQIQYPTPTLDEGYLNPSRRVQDKDKDKDKDKGKDLTEEGSGEKPTGHNPADIVALYPKRQSVQEAVEAVAKHIRAGVDPQTIIDGTKAIAAIIPRIPSGHLNTFVPGAARFFREKLWADDPLTWLSKAGNTGRNGSQPPAPSLGGRRPATVHKF